MDYLKLNRKKIPNFL